MCKGSAFCEDEHTADSFGFSVDGIVYYVEGIPNSIYFMEKIKKHKSYQETFLYLVYTSEKR